MNTLEDALKELHEHESYIYIPDAERLIAKVWKAAEKSVWKKIEDDINNRPWPVDPLAEQLRKDSIPQSED